MKKRKSRAIVSFDDEIVTKDNAVKFLSDSSVAQTTGNEETTSDSKNCQIEERILHKRTRKIKNKSKEDDNISQKITPHSENKKNKRKEVDENAEAIETEDTQSTTATKKKKRKKNDTPSQIESTEEPIKNDAISLEKPEIKKGESIREQKRKKHATLLEQKRLKADIAAQQHALNYLSKWKHSRDEWKFEKLKQIWLQQNLFDCVKIPNEFWDTTVEYFSGSKGLIRSKVLKNALQVIEKAETTEEQSTDENSLLTLQRARDVVQSLQE